LEIPHIPVLLSEVLEAFKDIKEGTIVDATLGYGGHSEALLNQNEKVNLFCIDRDTEAIAFSQNRLAKYGERVKFFHGDFGSAIDKVPANVAGILADIGVSSLQLDKNSRGFGFDGDTLDMRMDSSQEFSAYDVVNGYSEGELAKIILEYGEDRYAKKIASIIINARKKSKIESAKELSELISKNIPRGKIHPATLTFQAIRIEVNDELGQLKALLDGAKKIGKGGAILAIISFHSLEDRIVKQAFKDWSRDCVCPAEAFRCECGGSNSLGEQLTKKPIEASRDEVKSNPRSRSAKLRIFRFY
jgi:16S rRNA (cytosine1402-N4)-methyltransferase